MSDIGGSLLGFIRTFFQFFFTFCFKSSTRCVKNAVVDSGSVSSGNVVLHRRPYAGCGDLRGSSIWMDYEEKGFLPLILCTLITIVTNTLGQTPSLLNNVLLWSLKIHVLLLVHSNVVVQYSSVVSTSIWISLCVCVFKCRTFYAFALLVIQFLFLLLPVYFNFRRFLCGQILLEAASKRGCECTSMCGRISLIVY